MAAIAHELQRKLQAVGETTGKLAEYEERITTLGREIERLNSVIQRLNGELN